jgi:hypothetical protein
VRASISLSCRESIEESQSSGLGVVLVMLYSIPVPSHHLPVVPLSPTPWRRQETIDRDWQLSSSSCILVKRRWHHHFCRLPQTRDATRKEEEEEGGGGGGGGSVREFVAAHDMKVMKKKRKKEITFFLKRITLTQMSRIFPPQPTNPPTFLFKWFYCAYNKKINKNTKIFPGGHSDD